jgi:hypothetical protein
MREQSIMQRVQLEATRKGWRVFRNNVGCLMDQRGVPVRYGLMVGSGDLIGWRPVTITPDMVGQTLAQFVSLEIKGPRGRMSPEQARWAAMVEEAGGLTLVVRSTEDLRC